jgi:DNA-binding PadR family transcriptional regulator
MVMRRRAEELGTGEWAVLALVEEGPTHGFAVARAMEPEGEVGRIWSMRRPLVYRTLDVLQDRELTQTAGTEASTAGPQRTVIDVTDDGREKVRTWLQQPVAHVRDARSELMLKLLFLHRRGLAPDALLEAQRERFREQERELRNTLDASEGFSRTLALWRVENTAAAVRFVDALHR